MSFHKDDYPLTWFQRFAVDVLKCGPIPEHIAIIMDGNRRYARERNLEMKAGHHKGFDKLMEVSSWCRKLGVKEVTAYAFSIDNFKRNEKEVNDLFDIFREEFKTLSKRRNELMEDDICLRVIGNLNLLPKDIRKISAELTVLTKNNKSWFLNIAAPYTSRNEITNVIKTIAKGVRENLLNTSDIDEELLSECMFTNKTPDPDILLRTSGETRLSDFLLWQTQTTKIFFEKCMWPVLDFWTFLKIIFLFQRSPGKNEVSSRPKPRTVEAIARCETFLEKINNARWKTLHEYENYVENSRNI